MNEKQNKIKKIVHTYNVRILYNYEPYSRETWKKKKKAPDIIGTAGRPLRVVGGEFGRYIRYTG